MNMTITATVSLFVPRLPASFEFLWAGRSGDFR